MTNIFYKHYKRRDGAIYKDLAFLNHEERIKMLDEFIEMNLYRIKKNASKWRFCVNAISYYQKLKIYCNKNKDIRAIKYE
jgi:hypothetical protein